MTSMTTRPMVGAALPSSLLAQHRDWLLEEQRDLEIQDPYDPTLLDGDWADRVEAIRTQLAGYTGRLGVHGPFLSLTLLAYDPKVRTVVTERLIQGLAFAEAIAASHMVIHSPFPYFGSPFLAHAPSSGLSEQVALVHTTLEPVVVAAERARLTLVIENIQDTNPRALLDLVRSFDTPAVRMSLDTGHALISHRIGGPTPDQWVREAGPLLGHLHLQDTDGQLDRHWAPGDGSLNWFALFEALGELAHQPRLLLELRDPQAIRRGAAYLVERGLAR
jgi:sugar phosphate isomerase/epimerase